MLRPRMPEPARNMGIAEFVKCLLLLGWLVSVTAARAAGPFDAAPFGMPLPEGNGVMWDDPREIHAVTVEFAEPLPADAKSRLQYWGSHWPKDHLPKDREPGGGDVGWIELGNWYNGGWRTADAETSVSGKTVRFTFRPVNAREFPELKDYASTGRFTLKVRVTADQPLPRILHLAVDTDSQTIERSVRIAWDPALDFRPAARLKAEAFNGSVLDIAGDGPDASALRVSVVTNSDPNTFDRTLVTLRDGRDTFTFRVDDLNNGPLYLPEYGAAVLAGEDHRSFAEITRATRDAAQKTLYDRVAQMPEQTWSSAWAGMPPKKSRICFILGMDGARQKFRLDSDGGLFIRWNDQYMNALPGKDTPRLALEKPPLLIQFSLPKEPAARHLEEESIPTCITTWERRGLRITQTVFATMLAGAPTSAPPPSDAPVVAIARFDFTNTTDQPLTAALPVTISGGEDYTHLRLDRDGLVWRGRQIRGQVTADAGATDVSSNRVSWSVPLAAHGAAFLVLKMPFVPLLEPSEADSLKALDFERERAAIGAYWRPVLDKSARLITPEPVLNEFYRAVPAHLLINSELAPHGGRRFARVGSMNYGVYGNESCMMILDLDRRGYHTEAAECLEAWLRDQGTAGLPGDFDSKDGVLYGAEGYEAGGYNQHHGWILWTLAEHYRFTRDDAWLRRVTPNIVAAADWIIHQTSRAKAEPYLPHGLLPPGDLEDIGDWWSWLSTSCYTWRGLDGAAWALDQIHDPNSPRVRAAADAYYTNLLDSFMAASARSPVVRLRDGTAVPQIPSYVQRRGRSFGWICQTLEGPIHLIITKALDPNSAPAQWILKDYEDNLFLSNQYGYTLDDFDKYWFGRGGMSMQACLLFDVEAYLYRDDVKQALRAMFNAIALNHFPDVHMNTEHALPEMGDWRGDHYKTSDEANACGWLRDLFLREDGDDLLIGQAIPRDWLEPGKECGMENAPTYFGDTSVIYKADERQITATLRGPRRNPPRSIRLRFRAPREKTPLSITVNGRPATAVHDNWVALPGDIGDATIVASQNP